MENSNTSQILLQSDAKEKLPIDKLTYDVIEILVRIILTGSISCLGLVTNIVNVIVYYRQGIMTDSNNLSFAALAISDFFCCLFSLLSNIFLCFVRFADLSQYRWDPVQFFVFFSLRPKTIFIQITCWLTAYIAFERFVSVAFPFNVKQIFTPIRSLGAVCAIFLSVFVIYYPQYLSHLPQWVEYPELNTSRLEYVKAGIVNYDMHRVFLYLGPISLRIIAATIIVLCNIAILWKITLSREFRKSSTMKQKDMPQTITSVQATSCSNNSKSTTKSSQGTTKSKKVDSNAKNDREKRLIRMVTLICVVFLICFTPDVVLVIVFYVMSIRVHWYVHETAYAFSSLTESLNSSTNIFIYYSMSTRYKREFQMCLGKKQAK